MLDYPGVYEVFFFRGAHGVSGETFRGEKPVPSAGSELQRWGGDGTGGTGGGPVGGGMGRPLSFGGGKNAIFFFGGNGGNHFEAKKRFFLMKSLKRHTFVGNLYFEE